MAKNDQNESFSNEVNSKPNKKHLDTHLLIVYITQNAIVAAIYFVLTSFTQPISFGMFQMRLAEALGLLCFWRPDFAIGMTLGCFLSNVYSFSPWICYLVA